MDYGRWVYHITRKWETTDRDKLELIGFAVLMASFGDNGKGCHPMLYTLAQRSNKSKSVVQRLKSRCLEVGLIKKSGYTAKGVPIYDVGLPYDKLPPKAAETTPAEPETDPWAKDAA